MRKNLLPALFMLFMIAPHAIGQFTLPGGKIDRESLLEDYDFLLETMEATHPNLYAYIPREEFLDKTSTLREMINKPLSKPEFYKVLLQTISLIKQGHTMVIGDPGFSSFLKNGGLSFPCTIKYLDGQVYLDENYSDNEALVQGTELIAINQIPVTHIVSEFSNYLKLRPNGYIGKTLEYNWAKYLWLIYGFEDNFELSYILPNDDKIRTETLQGIDFEPRNKDDKKEKFKFRIDKDRNLAIITLNTFVFDFDVYDNYLKTSFKAIKDNEIENLIIDVRQNGGGNGNLINPLVDYLTDQPYVTSAFSQLKSSEATKKCYTTHPVFIHAIEQARKAEGESESFLQFVEAVAKAEPGVVTDFPKDVVVPTKNKDRFTGNLYVLTSRNTFSGATGFTVVVKDNHIGCIVGEETSDNPTDYGCIMLFELPHSKVNIQNSTLYTVRPAGYDDERGVIPDYCVKTSYSDFLIGTDKIMNYVYWMIENGIK